METMFLQQKSRGLFQTLSIGVAKEKFVDNPSSKSSWTLKETGNELTSKKPPIILIGLIQKIIN